MGRFDSAPRRRASLKAARGERGRWLSGVLIVAAIGAATVAVRLWPVPVGPAVRPVVALTPQSPPGLHFPQPVPASMARAVKRAVPGTSPARSEATDTPALAPEPRAEAAAAAASADAPRAAPGSPSNAPPSVDHAEDTVPVPLLAGRPIDVSALATAAAQWRPADGLVEPPTGRVERPGVAVTRVVAVAGRGIKTGLRATTAVFRAAF